MENALTPGDVDLLLGLRRLRQRMLLQLFIVRLSRAMLASAALAVVTAALERWAGLRIRWVIVGPAIAFGAVICSAVATFLSPPTLERAARWLDRRGATRDRWITCLSFEGNSDPAEMLAVQECTTYLRGRDFRELLPWRLPSSLAAVAAPLVTCVLLHLQTSAEVLGRKREIAAAQAEVASTVKQLGDLAHQLETAEARISSEELQKVARELRESAKQLESDAENGSDAARAALRELSRLEQLVQQGQTPSAAKPSEEDRQALANALEQSALTKDAAMALRAGDSSEAAKKLDAAAEQLARERETSTAASAEQTLAKAMQRLAEQKQLSEALRRLAKESASQPKMGEQTLRKMARSLRQSQGSPTGESPQSGGTQQSLQRVLAALQDMKQGKSGSSPSESSDSQKGGEGKAHVLTESFAQQSPGQMPQPGEAQSPTGLPGSEHDQGTSESPFGKERSDPADKGGEVSLKGKLGDGQSISEILPSAGGPEKAGRQYKELYEAMRPAAEDAVAQDDIPLGSRFFVKRYFEAIRPPQ